MLPFRALMGKKKRADGFPYPFLLPPLLLPLLLPPLLLFRFPRNYSALNAKGKKEERVKISLKSFQEEARRSQKELGL